MIMTRSCFLLMFVFILGMVFVQKIIPGLPVTIWDNLLILGFLIGAFLMDIFETRTEIVIMEDDYNDDEKE